MYLTDADVLVAAEEGVQRWIQAGLDEAQVEQLSQITYAVQDLVGSNLAFAKGTQVTIDENAAGNLWFYDQTIDQDEEFSSSSSTFFVAQPGTWADGKIDLLTVVMHEQGHVLGLDGVFGNPEDVMNEALQASVRRLPTTGQAVDATPDLHTDAEYLTYDATGGGQAFDNMQPYNTLNYVIALQGLYPSRSVSGSDYLGSVEMFAGNFAPRGYALAQGQLLPIAQNTALFSILGTIYGGDGRTDFALPDLRGRVPIGAGQGPGLTTYQLGQKSGEEDVTLNVSNLATHKHTVEGEPDSGLAGGGQPFENRQPTLALNPVVSLVGVYPSRSFSSDDLVGSVSWFAGNFAPRGTAFANGQLLPISLNQALFSILGTIYGGDGRTTFGLPDLRGRMAIHAGSGPGLAPVMLGQKGGSERISPTVDNLPSHQHGIPGTDDMTDPTGGGQSFDNRQPFLGLNYNIALFGTFPPRNLDAEDSTDDESGHPLDQGFASGDQVLEESEAMQLIAPLYQTGIAYWQAAGIDETQIAKLESVRLEIDNLSSGRLAAAGDNVITLDRDASNRGWFIDATPGDNQEFGSTDPRTGELVATDQDAYFHYDLLTVLMHEQGHMLGINHVDLPGQLMYGGLGIGTRRLPQASDLVFSAMDESEELVFLEGGVEPFIASVGMFAGNFNPRNWALTNGQVVDIATNQALFSLLGTTYGGDGRTTFGLPDLRGRAVVGTGNTGLTNYNLGQKSGTERVTLTVDQIPSHTHDIVHPPEAVDDDATTLEDTPVTIDVTSNDSDVDGNLDPTTVSIAGGPSNGALTNHGDGTITYAPALNFNGSDSFDYQVCDTDGLCDTATVTIDVTPDNDAPDAVNDNFDVDEDMTLNIAAAGVLANDADVDGDALTAVQASDPSNGTLTLNADGSFSYTPAANFNGVDSFTYQANDGTVDSNIATVNITVHPVNDAPIAQNDQYDVDEDTVLNIAAPGVLFNDSDIEGDSLTAVKVSDPSNGALTLNPDGSFTYLPDFNFNGSDSFTYLANDGVADSSFATVNITVHPVNDAPVAVNDNYDVDEDMTLNIAAAGVLANDEDIDGDALTAVKASDPSNGTLTLNADGSFSYTPASNFNGVDSFTYRANDGMADSNIATVNITVHPVNDVPIAQNDQYEVDEDTVLNIVAPGLLSNDSDVDGDPLSAVKVSDPSNGTLTLNSDGSFTYNPDPNFNGSDSFTYLANDGTAESGIATVNITIDPVNDAPVALNDDAETAEDVAVTMDVLENDFDVDGDVITVTNLTAPANGTSVINPDGTITYSPNADFVGMDSFIYTVVDDGGLLATAVATVTVISTTEQIDDLIVDVENLFLDGALNEGQSGSLTNMLQKIQQWADDGMTNKALNKLNAFINHVSGLIGDNVLTEEQGQLLLDAAATLQTSLETTLAEGMAADLAMSSFGEWE